jgi:hypothetical protein
MVLYEPRLGGDRIERRNIDGPDHRRAEGRSLVATKAHSLRWLEKIRESQRLTAREERRKEEILAVFRELHGISARRFDLPDFPPPQCPW